MRRVGLWWVWINTLIEGNIGWSVEMPPSPALKCSPGREFGREALKRSGSLENELLLREKDDDLALFNELQSKESANFLLQSNNEFEDSFSRRLACFSDVKLGISIPAPGRSNDLLNAAGEKNDYDWLLTPPDTPLFPSLDDEPPPVNLAQRGRPRSQPISISRSSTMEKNHKSSRGSASPQRSSQSPRSCNSVLSSRGRPSSAPHSIPNSTLQHATPSQGPSPPPRKSLTPAPSSSTPTPRRMSTGSSRSVVVSSGARGASPVKARCGNSASPKVWAWQSNVEGFSSDAPPNLRTSLADRPASYVRGSSPASSYGRDSSSKLGRQSISPTASRSVNSLYNHDRERFSSHSKGSLASSRDDDMDSLQSMTLGCSDSLASGRSGAFPKDRALAFSRKPSRTLSASSAPKRSFNFGLRRTEHQKVPKDMFRPLLSSVPSTTFYVGNANTACQTVISRNSSITSSSNASSDQGTSFAPDTEGSDQNHDDLTSEFDHAPSHEVLDEVFAFDKVDIVNEDIGQEICHESQSIQHGDFDREGTTIQFVCTDSQDSEALYVRPDTSEAVSSEDAVCSKCGCRYFPGESVGEDVKLCPDCSGEYGLLNFTIPVITEEYKPPCVLEPVVTWSESSVITGKGEIQREKSVEQGQCCYLEQIGSYLQGSSFTGSLAEECEDSLLDETEMTQPSADHGLPHSDTLVQQFEELKDHLNSSVDASTGIGISVLLLNRSSSIKGNVVQGRSFTATSVPYKDSSYARDGTISLRHQCTGSSFSGISDPACQSSGLVRSHEDNCDKSFGKVEYDEEEMPFVSQEQVPASEGVELKNANQSFMRASVLQEKNSSCYDGCPTVNSVTLEISSPNYEDPVSYENGEDFSKNPRGILDVEASAMPPDSSSEEHGLLNASLEGSEAAEVPVHSPFITTPEIEIENGHQNIDGPQTNVSTNLKSNVEEFQEPSVPPPSDKDLTGSVPGPSSSGHAHGILERSTVTVEGQGGKMGRSLTLEEATETILFCSSIVHDLAYQAAAISIEKENPIPAEVFRSTVTIVGKSSTDRKDLHNRTGGKRSLRSQKPRQKSGETDPRTLSSKTENDENATESLTQNVGFSNKIDSTKPPKLESKCNCRVM